jgi:hypothetical protein
MQKEEAKLAWWKVHATSATTCCKTWMGGIEDSKKEKEKSVLKKWLLQLEWEGRRPYHFESVIILSGPCFSATAPS